MRVKEIKFAEIRTFGEFYNRFAFLLEFNGKMWYNYKAAENTAVKIFHTSCAEFAFGAGYRYAKSRVEEKPRRKYNVSYFNETAS